MARSPVIPGATPDARSPAGTPAIAAETPATKDPVRAVARTALATKTEPVAPGYVTPPQGGGAPRRLRIDGAPRGEVRLNAAMKVLLDPVARASPSRVYSGQARTWNR
jgi:hypothetical protein